jgi:hypothetical protein
MAISSRRFWRPAVDESWLVPTNYTNSAISSQLVHSGNWLVAHPGECRAERNSAESCAESFARSNERFAITR